MATKAAHARDNAGLFLDHQCDKAPKLARSGRTTKHLVPAIVEGKRAHVYTPPKEPLERAIEIRIRVALAAEGILVLKHTIEPCYSCGSRPKPQTGLGAGTADLFCIVPPMGRVLFIEVKRKSTKNAKRDELQRKRAAVVRRHGGVAGVATCEAEALALLAEARRR